MVAKRTQNESIFNTANEILDKRYEQAGIAGQGLFLCECSDATCLESLPVDREEFRRRSDEHHFLVLSGHEDESRERVIEEAEGFTVVEKLG